VHRSPADDAVYAAGALVAPMAIVQKVSVHRACVLLADAIRELNSL